jgi:hypothetical protein
LSPLRFGVASFFIGGLYFEPTNEGCNNAPLFMALTYLAYQLLSNTWVPPLFRASNASNFDDDNQCFWGNKAYIIVLGLHGFCLIKNLTPSWATPVRKRVRALRK